MSIREFLQLNAKKFFDLKQNQFLETQVSPLMATSLIILVANTQFLVVLATNWSQLWILPPPPPPLPKKKNMGAFVFKFWVLRGLRSSRGLSFQHPNQGFAVTFRQIIILIAKTKLVTKIMKLCEGNPFYGKSG